LYLVQLGIVVVGRRRRSSPGAISGLQLSPKVIFLLAQIAETNIVRIKTM